MTLVSTETQSRLGGQVKLEKMKLPPMITHAPGHTVSHTAGILA